MESSIRPNRRGVDEITLVAGDKDYVTVVEDLVANGHVFDVVFWNHAARELKEGASKFIPLVIGRQARRT